MAGTDLTLMGGSPFENFRRHYADGDRWSARSLMQLMGYSRWENFEKPLTRAMQAARNTGSDVGHLFLGSQEKTGGRDRADWLLTRHAAYLVAMNGDPNKPEVAAAQAYFAAKTHEAETARPVLSAVPDLSGLSAEGLTWLGQIGQALTATTVELASARKELAAAQTKVEYVDEFVKAEEGACVLRVFANQVGEPEQALREWLIDRNVIYRTSFERWSSKKQCYVTVLQYHPYAPYRSWFTERDQPKAPRSPDGRMVTTLDITPVGKTGVRRMLERHPMRDAS